MIEDQQMMINQISLQLVMLLLQYKIRVFKKEFGRWHTVNIYSKSVTLLLILLKRNQISYFFNEQYSFYSEYIKQNYFTMANPHNMKDLLLYSKQLYLNSKSTHEIPDQYIDPDTSSPQVINISKYLTYLNNHQQFQSDLQKYSKNYPPIFYTLFTNLLQSDKIAEAIKFLEQNYRTQKNRHILIYNIGKLLQKVGDHKKAIFWYETLLKEDGHKRQIYVYNYVIALLWENRIQQGFMLLLRYMENKGGHKLLLDQLFLKILGYKNNREQISYYLELYFNNRTLPPLTIYNIAILLKNHFPEKSQQLFQQLEQQTEISMITTNKQPNFQFRMKIKINLLRIRMKKLKILEGMEKEEKKENEKQYSPDFKLQMKKLRENVIEKYREICEFVQPMGILEEKIKEIEDKNEAKLKESSERGEKSFIDAIFMGFRRTDSQFQPTKSFLNDKNKMLSKETRKKSLQSIPKIRQLPAQTDTNFQTQRKQNEQRLKFLIQKQKQLNTFFKNIKVTKENNKINIRYVNQSAIEKSKRNKEIIKNNSYEALQREFNKKKEKYTLEYKEQDIEEMIYEFLGDYENKGRKGDFKNLRSKINVEKINRFMDNLEAEKDKKYCETEFNIRLLEPKQNRKKDALQSGGSSKKDSKNTSKLTSNKSIANKSSSKLIKVLQGNNQLYNKFAENYQRNQKKQVSLKPLNQNHQFDHWLFEAECLENQKKWENALQTYEKMYKIFKETAQKETILLKIARNFEKLEFYEQAEKTYKKCAKINNGFQAFYRLGCLQVKNGAIKEGIQNLEKANCIERHNLNIQIKLVHAYSILEETIDRALSLANSILERNSNCLQALILTAKIFEKKGRLKDALDIGLAICSLKASPAFYHYVGLLYLQDSNINEAFKFFQLAIQCNPEYVPSLIELATILSETSTSQSIQLLKKTISLDDRNFIAYARLAKIYQTINQDYQSALSIYKKCLQIQTNYESYIKIGDCYQKMNQNMDSIVSYNKALGLKKTSEVFQKIGNILEKQKQQKKAIEAYINSLNELNFGESNDLNSQEQRKRILYKIGTLAIHCNDYEMATSYLLEVLDFQESFQVYKMLGHACFGKGEYSEALMYFRQASGLTQQDNYELLENIAMCFDKQEQYNISKEIYEKILQAEPKNVRCLNNLANIFLILGKTNQAFYWFQFMLQQIPNNIDKRLRVADIYATIGDWSKVQQHLLICAKQKQNDIRVLQRMVNLYKQKRDTKLATKFQKKLAFFKQAKSN